MAIDINEMNEMFVVEWSSRQKQFHIHTVGEMLKSNLHTAINGRNSGYVPVAIARTEAEALEMSNIIKKKVEALHQVQRVDSSDTLH